MSLDRKTPTSEMIFVTAFLGGNHGTAKSARDFLRAMLTCCESILLISPTLEEFPEVMKGEKLIRPTWLKVRHIRFPRRIWKWRLRTFFFYVIDKLAIKNLTRLTRKKTVVVNGWASYCYWHKFAHYFTGRKVIVVRESPRHFDDTNSSTTLNHLRNGFAEFDALIFVSKSIEREWLEFDELKYKPAYYLPNCCEEESVEDIRKLNRADVRSSYGWGATEFVVLCPATLIEFRKGQDLLVDILPELSKAISNLRVVFIGDTNGDWGKNLLEKMEKTDSSKHCFHMNSRPNILDLIYAADVLAFPSRAEAMPRTILEAMALGTPVVASAVDGVLELVDDRLSGILVQPNCSRSLLNGLVEIARNPKNRKRMATLGRKKYYGKLSRKHQLDRMSEILGVISCSN